MNKLLDDQSVVQRIFDHIDKQTTDLGEQSWREPVKNYLSPERFAAEIEVLRRSPIPFCPSAALPENGSYLAREVAGNPVLAVRGSDGVVRAFRNACRHRGMQVASGSGCQKAFVCRYHGWTYGLEGNLRHVPHDYGFPGLDQNSRGLAALSAAERHGLVFIAQDDATPLEAWLAALSAAERHGLVFIAQDDATPLEAWLDGLPENLAPMIPASYRLHRTTEIEVAANWKVFAEGFLEGYHIRPLHRETFYPVQFDNLNVVEHFGSNSRVAYPYRRINKLREVPPAERTAAGFVTYVYHLFPNVMVTTFPTNIVVIVLEPLAIDRTLAISYTVTDRPTDRHEAEVEVKRGEDFVKLGAVEDREVAAGVQRGLGSGANEFLEFGRFEQALIHFHRSLDSALAKTGFVDSIGTASNGSRNGLEKTAG